jgi:molybdate transport system substrate-binding protein
MRTGLLIFTAFCLFAACAWGTAAREVTVFAAASLTDALQDVGRGFEADSGIDVRFSFAGSSLLARQIEAGAAADVFLSADEDWMDYLAARGLIRPGSRRDALTNRLVLVAPADATVTLKIAPKFALVETLSDGRLALADPDAVPAGRYAKAALMALGVWEAVRSKIVRAENVRVALAYVARGEAKLGIVYATDATAEPRVRIVDTFPPETHPRVVYPAALTADGDSAEARAFLDYMIGPKAAAVFRKYGFGLAAER